MFSANIQNRYQEMSIPYEGGKQDSCFQEILKLYSRKCQSHIREAKQDSCFQQIFKVNTNCSWLKFCFIFSACFLTGHLEGLTPSLHGAMLVQQRMGDGGRQC